MNPIKKTEEITEIDDRRQTQSWKNCHESLPGMPRYEPRLMETGQGAASCLFMSGIHSDWLVPNLKPVGGFKSVESFCGSHNVGVRIKTNLAHRWNTIYLPCVTSGHQECPH